MNFRDGLGENSEFSTYHPVVNVTFYCFAIGIAMFSNKPSFIAIALICAWLYSVMLGGMKTLKMNLFFMIPVIIIMAVINVLFTHDGETVLMYINGNPITLEALYYGLAAAGILTVVIVWFASFNIVMTADKIVFLFGKAAPVLGLTLSMIFRFIPLLKARFAEISTGQKCMGRGEGSGLLTRAKVLVKEVSILISWSLESSIETADSMEARGYGLKGRSSFHLYRFAGKDYLALAAMAVTGGISIAGCILGETKMYYYPAVVFESPGPLTVITMAAYLILLLIPAFIDVKGECKWKQLDSMA